MIVMASGGGADRLQSHGVLSTTATRKIMQMIGEFNIVEIEPMKMLLDAN